MKKILRHISSFLLLFAMISLLASCGGNKAVDDQNLTPLQKQAVAYVKSHLDRHEKLAECEVIEEPMPAAILEQPFLNLRNQVFKAGLDYQSCKTRSLEAGMKMAEDKIAEARVQILATDSLLNSNIGFTNSVIVLAKVKTPKSHDGQLNSLIVVFDPQTMEAKEWIPVTTPVQNTVALVTCAKDNTLEEYAKEQNHATDMLASKVTDPVLKFVLDSRPM